mmetsp:Transcript_23700/g.54783  ORF Transcript_23700/g.54783 Transcript_23700/m.54783 type:complete len:391 (+) Transcript_23700:106-1278(+)
MPMTRAQLAAARSAAVARLRARATSSASAGRSRRDSSASEIARLGSSTKLRPCAAVPRWRDSRSRVRAHARDCLVGVARRAARLDSAACRRTNMACTMRARESSACSAAFFACDAARSTVFAALATLLAMASLCLDSATASLLRALNSSSAAAAERCACWRPATERTRSLCALTGERRASSVASTRAVAAAILANSACSAASSESMALVLALISLARAILSALVCATPARSCECLAEARSTLILACALASATASSSLARASRAAWRRKRAFSNLSIWILREVLSSSSDEAILAASARIAATSFSERLDSAASTRREPSSSARPFLASRNCRWLASAVSVRCSSERGGVERASGEERRAGGLARASMSTTTTTIWSETRGLNTSDMSGRGG